MKRRSLSHAKRLADWYRADLKVEQLEKHAAPTGLGGMALYAVNPLLREVA
jgi:hypothetical protein